MVHPRLLPFAVLSAMLYPLSFDSSRDDFPLSNYPMFARGRGSPHVELHYFVAVGEGGRRYVTPHDVANSEVLQARSVIRDTVQRGREASEALCRYVAGRLAGRPEYARRELRLVWGRHDAVASMARGGAGGEERIVTRCAIPPS